MKRALALALSFTAFGCGSKNKPDDTGSGSGTGTGSAPSDPTAQRLSELPVPPLPKLALPEDPKRAEKIALGHVLFFDKRLSGKNDRSCYQCHQNEDGNGGHDPIAIGSGDKKLTRHSPVIWNVAYQVESYYWDGRAKTLEANIKGAWGGGNMGGAAPDAKPEEVTAALDKRAAELAAIPGYKKLFEAAYPGTPIKADHAIGAIAEYMRTMICNDTAYDKFANGDKKALDEKQLRGLDIFLTPSLGNCILCHKPPHFSLSYETAGGMYFNVGIGTKDVPEDKVDIGRKKVTNADTDWAAFKAPTLRNITKSAPYFHDGSVAKLEDAARLMASGGIANKNKFPTLVDRKLTDIQLGELIAFLGALECPNKLEQPTLP